MRTESVPIAQNEIKSGYRALLKDGLLNF